MSAPLRSVLLLLVVLSACSVRGPLDNSDHEPVPQRALLEARALADAAPESAVAAFAALVEAHPGSVGAARGLQDARRSLEDATSFREHYEREAAANPSDGMAQYLYGRAVIDDPDRAISAFTKARQLDPLNPWPTIGLAYVHRARGDLFETVEVYRQALQEAPRSALLRAFLGTLYLELKLYVDARRELEVAQRLDPEAARTWSGLGRTYRALGHRERALEYLLGARERSPGLTEVYYDLSVLYLDARCPAFAEAMYQEGLEHRMPRDEELHSSIRAAVIVAGEQGESGQVSTCEAQPPSSQKS